MMRGIVKQIEKAIEENDGTQIKVILLYHKMKIDLEYKNSSGRTFLQECCMKGHLNIVRLLVDQGASLETKDNNGNTALHYACSHANFQITRFLIMSCADVYVRNFEGQQPVDLVTDGSLQILVEMAMTMNSQENRCMTMGRIRKKRSNSNPRFYSDKYRVSSLESDKNTNKSNVREQRRHSQDTLLDQKFKPKKSVSFNKDRRNSWTGKIKKGDSFKKDSSRIKSKILNKKVSKLQALRKVSSETDIERLNDEAAHMNKMHKTENTDHLDLVGLTIE